MHFSHAAVLSGYVWWLSNDLSRAPSATQLYKAVAGEINLQISCAGGGMFLESGSILQ